MFPVIMAGGSGTRFWPLSRKNKPKQFLPLASSNPLIVDTASRLKGVAKDADMFVVCGDLHAKNVKKLLKKMPSKNVLVEPAAQNTAPAIALATAHIARKNPDGIVVVLPSDQHVANVAEFAATLKQAAATAMEGQIVTLGISPTRPDTGYGYIKKGASISQDAFSVAAFVEKPDVDTAKKYLSTGEYLWNAGIFVFRADVMMQAFEKHMPELYKPLLKIQKAIGTRNYASVLKREFKKMPSISIDYGVAEKASNMAVVPGSFGWSDVGSFNALPEVRKVDAQGNVLWGKGALVVDCEGCVIVSDERPVSVVGMKDVVVVDTKDAILVLPKDRSQDVRKVVEELKRRKWDKYV